MEIHMIPEFFIMINNSTTLRIPQKRKLMPNRTARVFIFPWKYLPIAQKAAPNNTYFKENTMLIINGFHQPGY